MSDPRDRVKVLPATLRRRLSELAAGPTPSKAKRLSLEALREHCLASRPEARAPQPLRTLHHFACTGGTLVAKALASMPNTVVLSEIDPLSQLHLRALKPPFFPTDLTTGLRYSSREIGDNTILKMFAAAVLSLRDEFDRTGLHLLLRDHAHSQYCTVQDRHTRPNLHAIVGQIAATRAVVTVRHPLDSFLSLQRNGWLHFEPKTFEEYCLRYLDFLAAHKGLPIFQYEAFVAAPDEVAAQMCKELDLPFNPDFEFLMPMARLTGDSGRSGNAIAPRSRGAIPAELRQQADQSESYAELCQRLNYDT